jgi:hypothetical protein
MRVRLTGGESLKTAAKVIADTAKVISGRFSRKIPAAMKVYLGPGSDVCFIAAGSPTGRWGWTPVNAWMFEEMGSRHPLFAHGPKRTDGWLNWYGMPYRPFMEEAAETSAQAAAEVYGDLETVRLAKLYGYTKAGLRETQERRQREGYL